ncbi:lysophospholipid acyltransferase family protein [Cetobacterium sp. SF1]|uniref:lysophospholipid acyltransferase family protein n=1 Tax=unclassified Cetobacterium TaxID=2630983 RepID=UPI003CF20F4D
MSLKNIKYRLEYVVFRILKGFIQIFPEKFRFSFANFLGKLSYTFIKKRRLIALANLKLAFPEKSEEERIKIAKKSFQVMSRAFLSTLWFEKYLANPKNIKFVGDEHIDEMTIKNKGAIAAMIHMGNMEAPVKLAEKYPLVTVAKKQRNPYIDDFITNSRKKLNITLLKKSKTTTRDLLKHIDKKEIIGLFSDHRDKGATVDFFGEDTVAPTGAVSLALKYNIPLFLCFNVLADDNTSTTYISDEIDLVKTGSFKNDVQENTQRLIYKMESIISRYPEQWMWFHDRWKLYKKLYK